MTSRPGAPKPRSATEKKKSWQAPQVKSGRLFESNSLGCNKLPYPTGQYGDCQENPSPNQS